METPLKTKNITRQSSILNMHAKTFVEFALLEAFLQLCLLSTLPLIGHLEKERVARNQSVKAKVKDVKRRPILELLPVLLPHASGAQYQILELRRSLQSNYRRALLLSFPETISHMCWDGRRTSGALRKAMACASRGLARQALPALMVGALPALVVDVLRA